MAEEQAISGASGRLRACLNCSVIRTLSFFKQHGCPNCPFLEVNKGKNLYQTTSASFKGLISLKDPKQSWVAKWQRIDDCQPGMYAMTVDGVLNDEFIMKIEQCGRVYIDRSQSFEIR